MVEKVKKSSTGFSSLHFPGFSASLCTKRIIHRLENNPPALLSPETV
jgi:hypothetical protein